MIKWFKKNKKEETKVEETKWTYSICVDNVPDNDLTPIQFGTLQNGNLEDIVIPRVGERMCCRDYNTITTRQEGEYIIKAIGGLEYTGVVKEVFYNYPLKFVCITFVCEEVRKTWK